MKRWPLDKSDWEMYGKRKAWVITIFTVLLVAGMCLAIGYGIYCTVNGTPPPLRIPTWPYD